MNSMLETTIVALVIAASAAYALWSLGPRSLKVLIARALERVSGGRYSADRILKNAPGCNACDDCATQKPKAPVVELHRSGSAGPRR